MKPYILVTDEDQTETQELLLRSEEDGGCPDEQALFHLGYRVEPSVKTEDVREFFLVDSDSGKQVHSFKDFLYENACNFALSYLGYSLFESTEEDYIPAEQASNILAFEL
jgi:hypothetical protein